MKGTSAAGEANKSTKETTIKPRKRIKDLDEQITAQKHGISNRDVSVQILQGSLVVEAESDQPDLEWPDEEEVATIIDTITGGASLGDRLQTWDRATNAEDSSIKLISEETIILQRCHGEQDSKNQVPYMKWALLLSFYVFCVNVCGLRARDNWP